MSTRQSASLLELFRDSPGKCSLLTLGPVALAAAQLSNSYVNGLPVAVAAAFAAVMIAFAVVATGHHAAEYRLRRLEREIDSAKN